MAKAAATAKPMTKAQLIAELAGKTELTKKQVGDVLSGLTELAYKEAQKGLHDPRDRQTRRGQTQSA